MKELSIGVSMAQDAKGVTILEFEETIFPIRIRFKDGREQRAILYRP